MYPVLILLTFSITMLLRKKLHTRRIQERIHGMKLRFRTHEIPMAPFLQPYSFFLLVLLVGYLWPFVEFMELMADTQWLNPETFTLPQVNSTVAEAQMKNYDIPTWLRCFSWAAPFCVGITFVITAVHVVLLPLVYGVFGMYSVYEMLLLMSGRAFTKHQVASSATWETTVDFYEQTYSTSLQLADLYEAWALRAFGLLCFNLVRRQVSLEVPTVKYIIERVEEQFNGCSAVHTADERKMSDLVLLRNPRELLLEPLQQTSYMGIRVFVWTYALKSLYLLGLVILGDAHIQLCGSHGIFPAACSFTGYVDGAAFLASTLAIYNMVIFEQSLKKIFARVTFKPFEKFLSVKALVSISFMQDFALEVVLAHLWDFSDAQIKLCYAALICIEVMVLSVFVYIAWKPPPTGQVSWYSYDAHHNLVPGVQGGQLADERDPGLDDDRTFQEAREPQTGVQSRQAHIGELTGVIELRGDFRPTDGRALETLVNTWLHDRGVGARYKPATLFKNNAGGSTTPTRPSSEVALTQPLCMPSTSKEF